MFDITLRFPNSHLQSSNVICLKLETFDFVLVVNINVVSSSESRFNHHDSLKLQRWCQPRLSHMLVPHSCLALIFIIWCFWRRFLSSPPLPVLDMFLLMLVVAISFVIRCYVAARTCTMRQGLSKPPLW